MSEHPNSAEQVYRRDVTKPSGMEPSRAYADRHLNPPHAPAVAPGGYWNYVAGAVFLLFIFYITANGSLKAWLDILVWAPGTAPKATGASQTPTGIGPLQPRTAASTANTAKGGQANAQQPVNVSPWGSIVRGVTGGVFGGTPAQTGSVPLVPAGQSIWNYGIGKALGGLFGGGQ